jgi:hypothetical protein
MVISNVLEIAIGMLLIYTILSLISSAVTELIAEWLLSLRSKNLYRWVSYLLSNGAADKKLAENLYNHPLITSLSWREADQAWPIRLINKIRRLFASKNIPFDMWRLPTNIPAQRFVIALLDEAQKLDSDVRANSATAKAPLNPFANVNELEATIQKIQGHDDLKKQLLALVRTSNLTIDKEADELKAAFKNIETWFDNAMEQATVRYRQSVRNITFFVGLALCVMINADSLMMVNALSNDPAVRSMLVARAETFELPLQSIIAETTSPTSEITSTAEATPEAPTDAETTPPEDKTNTDENTDRTSQLAEVIKRLQTDLSSLDLFGWSSDQADRRAAPDTWSELIFKFIGIAITSAAISLGSPFWFDLLKKLTAMRKENQGSEGTTQPTT